MQALAGTYLVRIPLKSQPVYISKGGAKVDSLQQRPQYLPKRSGNAAAVTYKAEC